MADAYNDQGVEHVQCRNLPAAEKRELYDKLEAMRTVSIDHNDRPVFNPAVSRRQARAMYAAAEGHSTLGISPKVGKEYTEGFSGKPGSVKRLPAQKRSRKG